MAIQTQAKIPVLDFSNVDEPKPDTRSWLSARKDVCRALEEYGCFVAEFGSRVPLDLHNTMFGLVRELFDFPKETKRESETKVIFVLFLQHINGVSLGG
ncbi:putative 2-oxoglutarate-dependent dioxygenase AOP1 [Morella rubra]|uniref:Putative 2-oxoglutarate-dependent dioxygenase AOP1 n=1 Tax=Morella rubra TaxID=262757 RepID=A0A6A1VNS9_9ROSI|nr:putative 2-oxoglutarate-dependent dioxygenase AOP1 [Morella rubra]